jgi:hypothetical protein
MITLIFAKKTNKNEFIENKHNMLDYLTLNEYIYNLIRNNLHTLLIFKKTLEFIKTGGSI